MEPVLYVDILFLFNGLMQILILFGTGLLARQQIRIWRLIAGGFAASFCFCLFLYLGFRSIISAVVFQILAIGIAFAPKTLRQFLQIFVSLWFCTFLIGGGLSAAMSMTDLQMIFGTGISYRKPLMSWKFFLWAWLFFFFLFRGAKKWMEVHIINRDAYCSVEVTREEKTCSLTGFVDTGNGLTYEGNGVPIVEFSACMSLFPKEITLLLLKKAELEEAVLKENHISKISYQALGVEKGTLYLFCADRFRLKNDRFSNEYQNIQVGIHLAPFDGKYEVLVPPMLLEGEKK